MSEKKKQSIPEQMVLHTGTKNVKAVPMTKAEYLEYRGWDLPDGEDPKELVYLIEYEADPKSTPNHPDHEGYISMSPKHVFDEAYRVSETYLDRLAIERSDLNEKITKLTEALKGDVIPRKDKATLRGQLEVMTQYLVILDHRIKNAN